jgi:hypothetical protein
VPGKTAGWFAGVSLAVGDNGEFSIGQPVHGNPVIADTGSRVALLKCQKLSVWRSGRCFFP